VFVAVLLPFVSHLRGLVLIYAHRPTCGAPPPSLACQERAPIPFHSNEMISPARGMMRAGATPLTCAVRGALAPHRPLCRGHTMSPNAQVKRGCPWQAHLGRAALRGHCGVSTQARLSLERAECAGFLTHRILSLAMPANTRDTWPRGERIGQRRRMRRRDRPIEEGGRPRGSGEHDTRAMRSRCMRSRCWMLAGMRTPGRWNVRDT